MTCSANPASLDFQDYPIPDVTWEDWTDQELILAEAYLSGVQRFFASDMSFQERFAPPFYGLPSSDPSLPISTPLSDVPSVGGRFVSLVELFYVSGLASMHVAHNIYSNQLFSGEYSEEWRSYVSGPNNVVVGIQEALLSRAQHPLSDPNKDGDVNNDIATETNRIFAEIFGDDYQQINTENKRCAINEDLSLLAAFLAKIVTPLVIDMDGDGVELVSLADSTAFFDLNIDGYAELTGWVNPDDALLALDVDGDGIIDDNSELFGNQTGFANGFLALAAHDANADGVIDANDAVYADLIVWQDLDGDGFSDAGEMMGLADAGIVSISLNSTSTDFTNQGHWVSDVSTVTWGDGTNTSIEDVHFENDTRASVALLPDDFQYHVDAFKLPVLFGYGQIASTWVVLSQDATLRADAEALLDLLAVGNVSGFMTAFEDYLLAWADVDHIDPNSRNSNIHGTQTGMDARYLTFLEKAYGQGYIQKWWDGPGGYSDPHHLAARQLTAQFEDLVEMLAGRFIAQSATSAALMAATTQTEFDTLFNAHLFSELTGLVAGYSPSNRGLEGDLQPVLDSLVVSIQSGEIAPEEAARLFYIMHHDMEPDATLFSDQLRNLADINGAAEAYMLSEGVRALADGHQLAFGTSGNDILSTNDYGLIVGGKGNDTLSGGAEADLYIYTSGDGSDVIEDVESFYNRTDRLVFTDIDAQEARFSQNAGGDLVIALPDGSIVTVRNHFDYGPFTASAFEIERIEFADGTVLNLDEIRQKSIADQKAGGAVVGTKVSENYTHAQGDGSYTITDAGNINFTDSLTFTDVSPHDVTFSKTSGHDLRIELANGEVITIIDHFKRGLSGLSYANAIENIGFADGTVLDAQAIRLKSVADQKTSGSVLGTEAGETYFHAFGDGSYTITDFSSISSEVDRLVLSDVNVADVSFEMTIGNDLAITLPNGETITFIDHFQANSAGNYRYRLEEIEFADGTVLDGQDIRNKHVADQKASGTVIGSGDVEHYYHALGDGSYSITDYSSASGQMDRLDFTDIGASDAVFGRTFDNDLTITLTNGEVITIIDYFQKSFGSNKYFFRIEEIEFADGSIILPADLADTPVFGTDGDDTVFFNGSSPDIYDGLGGNDSIFANAGNDTIWGGDGNDTLNGSVGDDFLYGDAGDDLILGDTGDDYYNGGTGNDTLDFSYSSDGVRFDLQAETVSFTDGAVQQIVGFENVIAGSGDNQIIGNAMGNNLHGGAGNDSLYGGAGDDTLNAGEGDTYSYGGAGNDLVYGSFGDDTMDGGDGYDTLDFTYSADDVAIDLYLESAVFSDGFTEQILNFEAVIAGAGHNTINGNAMGNNLHGGAGNDVLNGADGADSLLGGAGNDSLYGGAGDDTLNAGEGDTYSYGGTGNDHVYGSFGDDTMDGGDGYDTLDFTYSADDVAINLDLERAVFANGFTEQILNFEAVFAGAGNNTITGSADGNYLNGGDGDDTIAGLLGDDTLTGGSGADVFVFSDDTLSTDQVTDFDKAEDLLDISAWGAASFGDLTVSSVETSTLGIFDVEVSFGGNALQLLNVSQADLLNLSGDDFVFS